MQAIKDLVLHQLNAHVSPYVENLNAQDLSFSVFSGHIQFHNLRIKKTVLERFGLPVQVIAGNIGTLSITIPWQTLKSQPVKIVIDDVYILARARPQGKVDEAEDERVEQATKQQRLKSAEEVDRAANQVKPQGDTDKQGFFGALIQKTVDNVQIQVKGIHLRYEDDTNTPEHPFAAGFTLSEFRAVSADENWVEAFIQDSLKGVHKLVKLGALSVYFDTDNHRRLQGDNHEIIEALKSMLERPPQHQYILKPVTGEARVIVNHTMSSETPKVDAQVIFDEIGVVLDRDQYRDALSVLDIFHFYRRTHQYHKFRPPESEFQENPARARLKFALNAIQAEVRDRNKRWTWDYLSERRDMRKQYVDVYVKRLALPENKPLAPEDAGKLEEMETKLSYEDIRFFRSVARAKARQDEATRRKLEAEKRKNEAPRQTWGEWLWGGNAKSESADQMTEEEKKELDEIIDYDATAITIGNTPKDFIKARVSARLNKGSLSLKSDPNGVNQDVISLVFDTFTADATQFADSIAARLALGGFSVYDGTKPGSLYTQIVRVKDRNVEQVNKAVKGFSVDADAEEQEEPEDGSATETQDPFFVLEAEHNPLDGRADNAVTIKMRHLEIIYHKGYVESVVQFFKPPESQLESIGALLDAAGQTLDGLRKETRAGLEYALEQHKTVDIKLDMNAPIIIIPMDVTRKDSQALVLDAGHIAVVSRLADKDEIKEVQSKRGKQYSQDDYKQLEDLMYDRLSLRLESTQLLMGGNVDLCLQALENEHAAGEMDLHILERINMSFSVQNAIINAPNLTRFKISGDLPELQVNFSDTKYKTLMRFIDISIPKFGDDTPANTEAPVPRPRNKTFRPPPIEEYNLDDNRSIRSLRVSEDDASSVSDRGDKFYEAHDDTTDSQRAAMQQISFEFSFQVGKVQASLFRSTPDGQEKALADATLEGFGLTFALRQYDMSVDLFLRNVTLAMVEQGKIKRPLLSSAAAADASDVKLVKVRYMKVQKNSPDYMTKHDAVDQSVETELSSFKITVAPEPILALNDFIMTTFVPQPDQAASQTESEDKTEAAPAQQSADKIRVRVRLTSAQISLENNDQPFALLALTAADVAIMLRSGTMRVGARLGNLSLEDVSNDQVANPDFKKLLAIEGSELADFSYETFDPTDTEVFPGYNSAVRLRTGSLKFTFMEATVRNLYTWALRFARLKAVYDAASQAAVNRAAEVTRMHYDVVVKTPIVVLPRDGVTSEDALVFRLGEISAKNEYLADAGDTTTIDAGLRGINVTSDLFVDGKKTTLTMVDDVAITAAIRQIAKRNDAHKADTEVKTNMSDVKMSLTQRQYALLMSVLQSLPRALSDATEAATVESGTVTPQPQTPSESTAETSVDLRPELSVSERIKGNSELWTSLDVQFAISSIALEVFTEAAITLEDQKMHSIARFALVDTTLSMKQLNDGAMEAEFGLSTISFSSTRSGKTAFRDIIPAVTHGGKQIMMQYTKSGGPDGSALAIVTVDSPKIILSVDPLASLLEFAVSPFKTEDNAPPTHEQPEVEVVELDEEVSPKPASLSFRVEVIQSTIMVLADDADPKSQAIQLHVKEILLSQQSIMALKVDQLSMSFGRMDKMHERVSFLDRLNIALSLDTRQRGNEKLTSFDIDIPDPIIFRASYSDIMLIVNIVNKATAAATKAMSGGKEPNTIESKESRRTSIGGTSSIAPRPSTVAKSKPRRASVSTGRKSVDRAKVIVSKEQLKAHVNGFQLVLIGDLQEIPFIHLATDEFQIAINDWSGDMRMATSMTTSIRYFNPSNSYFEPLLDPWKFDFKVSRVSAGPDNNPMDVSFTSRQRLELNISAAFIELMLSGMAAWGQGQERLRSERGTDAPFRIRNLTGKQLALWCESRDPNKPPTGVKLLDDGGDVPWRFEDRRTSRDNVSGARHNSLGVHIQDTPWEAVRRISVDREGEHVLLLRPKIEQITHQLMCDIKVENNVKIITFRSTMNVENDTSLPIEMVVVDSHGKAAAALIKIPPGSSHPLPLTSVFDKRFRLRPLRGFNFDFNWSMPLYWKHLVSKPIRPISCGHRDPGKQAFYFQARANLHTDDKTAQLYPRMTLTLRAPIEIENLLPYDIKWKIHDKNTGLSSSEWLMKGGACPIHTVELSHLLLVSIEPMDCGYAQSEYAIINTDDPEFRVEKQFNITDRRGISMPLKLNYITYPNAGGAKKVQIYSSYVVLNKTGLPFNMAIHRWNGNKEIAGSSAYAEDYTQPEPTPFLLNFDQDEDKKPKMVVQLKDSTWSKPVAFAAPAADMALQLTTSRGSEYHAGLSYAPGIGKYASTRVITLAPRWVIVNNFEYGVSVRQAQTDKTYEIKPGNRKSLLQVQDRAPLHLCLAAESSTLKWSAPVSMNDIGRSHVVLHRQASDGIRRYLVRIETHIQGSSIFLYVTREKEPWPMKIRNETSLPLTFRQVDDGGRAPDGNERDLPPHEDVEYTWDQPTAGKKRIRISMEGVPLPTLVDIMAMGIQPPVKMSRPQGRRSATLSIDVRAEGASQLLVISPYDEETSVYKPARKKGPVRSDSTDSLSTLNTQFEAIQVTEKPSLTVTVDFEGIGISIIDKKPQELVYITLRGLKLGYTDYPHYYDTYMDLKWIQVDNQLFGASFPIVLFPVQVPSDIKELEGHPTIQTSVAVLKDQSHGVIFVKYATILLQEIALEIDEGFLFALLEFSKLENASQTKALNDVLLEHPTRAIPEPDGSSGQADYFFEFLQLQPIALKISFMRSERTDSIETHVSPKNPVSYVLNAMSMTLANINEAPLNFRSLMIENGRMAIPALQERIILHYKDQVISQVFHILGSADFLGNPVGLFNNLGSAVGDIFYEPYLGVVMHGNKDIGLGIARGASSFAKKTVFGITDSMTKFTSSIGKGLSAATLDNEYQARRRMAARKNKPKHAIYGVAVGATAFANSMTSAFEGVAAMPMQGIEKDGAAGFAKGVGKGFVGLFTKPVVGVVDFLSHSTEGIRNTTTVFDQGDLDKVRNPRFIAADGVIRSFSAREALGQSWLRDLDNGKFKSDAYVAHLDVPGDDAVTLLSNERLVLFQLRKLKLVWQVSFAELSSLQLEERGIALMLRGEQPGPFIPIPDKTGRDWLFKNIGKVVSQYNRAHAQKDDA